MQRVIGPLAKGKCHAGRVEMETSRSPVVGKELVGESAFTSSDLLRDPFARTFRYLRLSITQTCNFRCSYCLPNGCVSKRQNELSVPEIRHLTEGLAELGVKKVRLTGGEPTTRGDLLEIARSIRTVPGIEQLALTTNGYRLEKLAPELKAAGVTAVNVSVDSLSPGTFQEITGQDRLPEVLRGVDRVLELDFAQVKLNVVLLRGWNDQELASYVAMTRERPVSVRFIELMRTGDNAELFGRRHLSTEVVSERLRTLGWSRFESIHANSGPAVQWTHPAHRGSIGIIAPYSKDFCHGCNRLRVTSEGALKLCLFGEGDYSLRQLLQNSSQRSELKETIQELLKHKPAAHFLHEGKFGNVRDLARIGG